MSTATAPLVEVFSSIQGEGLFVGERQLFVRFARCNLECAYCDTPESRNPPARCVIESEAGTGQFRQFDNPVTVEQLCTWLVGLDQPRGLHHSVSLTGGEPLCHAEFLEELLPALADRALARYLETNGTLPDALSRLLPHLDFVAMDLKLPSATGQPAKWDEHREFLALLINHRTRDGRPITFTKAVVAAGTTEDEVVLAAQLVADISPAIPMVIQPVTAIRGVIPASAQQVLSFQAAARAHLRTVRVIPQMHKLMGQR